MSSNGVVVISKSQHAVPVGAVDILSTEGIAAFRNELCEFRMVLIRADLPVRSHILDDKPFTVVRDAG